MAPHTALTNTGTPAVKASTTVREKASKGDGDTRARAPRRELPFRGVVDHAGDDDVVGGLGLVDHLAHQDEAQVPAMTLLVGAEEPGQHCGALLLVHPADADQVRRVLQTEGPADRVAIAGLLLLHTKTDENLRRRRHIEPRLHQTALAPGLEYEAPAAREQLVEDWEVQSRLLVGRRVHDGALGHQGQSAHVG